MDGWVIVGTKLDTKQLEKDLKNAEQRLKQYEREAEKLTKAKAKAEVDLQPYEEQKRIIQEMTDEMNKYAQTEAEVTKNLEIEKQQIEELNTKYEKQLKNLDDINLKIKENAKNQGLVTNEIQETNEKLTQAKGFGAIKESIKDVGKSMTGVLKKVARWTFAIVGVRTAYNAVRNAISMVAGANDEVSDKLDYMKNGVTNALIPAVQSIVNWLYKMMVYVNYIVKQLFGKELFDFSQSSKDSKETVKNLEKAKKTLAGFDEMNVISDTSTSGGSGAGTGNVGLTNPFEDMGEIEIPEWVDKIVTFGQWVLDNWEQVVGQLLLFKLVIDLLTGNWIGVVIDIIAFIILGVTQIWKSLKDLWASVSELFDRFTTWIAENIIPPIVEGFKAMWLGIVTGAINMWNGLMSTLKAIPGWIYNYVIEPIGKFFVGMWDGFVSAGKGAWEGIKGVFSGVATFFKNIFTNAWTAVKNVFSTGGKIFTGIKDGIVDAFKKIVNTLIDGINKVVAIPFNTLNATLNGIRNVDILGVKPFKGLWGQNPIGVPKIPKLAVGGLVNLPGKGVPIGGTLTGEVSTEGVIPLTDSQAMETLGATIGKYININLTNITKLDNKQIAKEQKKINAQTNFAFNK